MNTKVKTIGIGAAGAAILALAAVGVTQLSPIGAAQADDKTGALTASVASTVSPLYSSAQKESDKLPAFLLSGPQKMEGIVPTSTHLLGVDEGTKAWAALNTSGEACLISLLPGTEQWASATCATPAKFAEQGIGLQAATQEAASRLYFVPSGYGAQNGLDQVGPQLLAADPDVSDKTAPELTKEPSAGARTLNSETSKQNTLKLLPFQAVEDLRE